MQIMQTEPSFSGTINIKHSMNKEKALLNNTVSDMVKKYQLTTSFKTNSIAVDCPKDYDAVNGLIEELKTVGINFDVIA